MRSTGGFDDRHVPAEQRLDIGEVLPDRGFVALPLVVLVPLVMVMEDQRDDVVEAVDEPVRRR